MPPIEIECEDDVVLPDDVLVVIVDVMPTLSSGDRPILMLKALEKENPFVTVVLAFCETVVFKSADKEADPGSLLVRVKEFIT